MHDRISLRFMRNVGQNPHRASFDNVLATPEEEVDFQFSGHGSLAWLEFILNPRRLRGSDFLMRWSQGQWSEERLLQAINATGEFHGIAYGPSGVAPSDPRAFELYFERLEEAGLGDQKRPDLLVFAMQDRAKVVRLVEDVGGAKELPFTKEEQLEDLLRLAIMGIECENSLWKAKLMPAFNTAMKPQKRLGGKLGFSRTAVLPTVIVKEEDRAPLRKWQESHQVPIHVWHAFFDMAYGVAFDRVEKLVEEGFIEPSKHVFQAPNGVTTEKILYKIYYTHAYKVSENSEEPSLKAESIIDKNGHVLPYVCFSGGRMLLDGEALEIMRKLRAKRLGV